MLTIMSGIYIHIPYCKQKCHYCNFFSLATTKYRNELVPALEKEIEIQKEYLEGEPVGTIYFGGGTPSMLSELEVGRILQSLHRNFTIENGAEITLEANPDDLSTQKLSGFRNIAINRLSIGVQSFNDEDLVFLNRVHSGKQALNSIKRAQDNGFQNLSIDLIYGIPTLDTESWESNLMTTLETGVPHISAYALTVEDKTPLSVMIRKGKMPAVDEGQQADHFRILVELLEAHGFSHYEISNFCRPGMVARHNTSYWQGVPYLGLGPSAHSYNRVSRQWNVSNLEQYIQKISTGVVPFEQEVLTQSQRFNEYVMTSLRTMWGCDLSRIEKEFGRTWKEQAIRDVTSFIHEGLVNLSEDKLFLTADGKFRADGIAAEMFRVEDPLK